VPALGFVECEAELVGNLADDLVSKDRGTFESQYRVSRSGKLAIMRYAIALGYHFFGERRPKMRLVAEFQLVEFYPMQF
jgi:hypothetical protein